MPRIVELLCSRRLPQAATLALISFAFAGCSADTSSRFAQDPFAGKNPFSNPFNSRSEATGSVPTPQVERRDLPQRDLPQRDLPQRDLPQYGHSQPQTQPYSSSAVPPPAAAPQSYSAPSSGWTSGSGPSGWVSGD